jgi:hypothetical protein
LLVIFFHGHGQQQIIVLQLAGQVLIGFDATGQKGALFKDGGGLFGRVPEIFPGDDGFQLAQTDLLGGYVKDSLRVG